MPTPEPAVAVAVIAVEDRPPAAPVPATPERIPPVFTTPMPVASAPAPAAAPALPALAALPAMTPPPPETSAPHAEPDPVALWRARLRAGPALSSYSMLDDVAASFDADTLPAPAPPTEPPVLPPPGSAPPPRRKARSAGRAAISATRPH